MLRVSARPSASNSQRERYVTYRENRSYCWLVKDLSYLLRAHLTHHAARPLVEAVAESLLACLNESPRAAYLVQARMNSLKQRSAGAMAEIYQAKRCLRLFSAAEQRSVQSSFVVVPLTLHDIPCKIFPAKCEHIGGSRFSSCNSDI
jgi:hypothetical protein